MITKKIVKNLLWHLRPETLDEYVVKEMYSKPYRLFLKSIDNQSLVFDLGANIGAFSRLASKNANRVLSVEPCKDNQKLFAIHNNAKRNIKLIKGAIVHKEYQDKQIKFYLNGKKNKGLHSIVPTKGRDVKIVEAYKFQDLYAHFKPTHIKCDIEGGEFPIIDELIASTAKHLLIEIHLLKDRKAGLRAYKKLRAAFPKVIYCSNITQNCWVINFYGARV